MCRDCKLYILYCTRMKLLTIYTMEFELEFFHFSQFGTSQALDSLLEHGQSTLVYVYILFLSTRLGAVPLGARREHVVIPRTTKGRLLFTILLFQSSFMFGTLFSSP